MILISNVDYPFAFHRKDSVIMTDGQFKKHQSYEVYVGDEHHEDLTWAMVLHHLECWLNRIV